MTFAPQTLLEVRRFFQARYPWMTNDELGITGGPSHVLAGTSYHLGKDQLKLTRDPYSARTSRDKAGLSNAASAFDLDDSVAGGPAELQQLSMWVVEQCRTKAADTLDIREVIYSPDGWVVLTWDREKGVTSYPQARGSVSHRGHTHFSYYRDAENRPKVGLFQRFYRERADGMSWEQELGVPGSSAYPETGDAPVPAGVMLSWSNSRIIRLENNMYKVLEALARLEAGSGSPITDEQLERVLRKVLRSVPAA